MGLFNSLKSNKNYNILSSDEKVAAEVFMDLVNRIKRHGFYMQSEEVKKLSAELYYLSFKRSNKKVVRLEEAANPLNVMSNPKILQYFAAYSAIKDSIEEFCRNRIVLTTTMTKQISEETVLTLLKYSASQINRI